MEKSTCSMSLIALGTACKVFDFKLLEQIFTILQGPKL
jgi:hypothetical protein